MTVDSLEQEFQKKVCSQIRLESEGINRYRVRTPFMFDDGDHLVAILRKQGDRWFLTDEGHTYMHLTYEMDERDLLRGSRQKIITTALSAFGIEDCSGELMIPIEGNAYGDALYSFIQGLLKITDVTYLSRERVRSTFMDDFKRLLSESVPEDRRVFDWHDPIRDPKARYVVDCYINRMSKPILVHALQNDARTRDATISLLQFEKWGMDYHSVAIFEDQEAINRRVLARFSDVGEKQFSSLKANEGRIVEHIKDRIL